jgi:hypothetical protein
MRASGRALLGAVVFAAWAAAVPIAHAAAPQLTVTPVAGPPGATVTVTGTGFCAAPCLPVDVSFGGQTVRSGVSVGANGHFRTAFTVPASALGGVNNVFAEQRDTSGTDRQASTTFRVTPSTPVNGSSPRRTSPTPHQTTTSPIRPSQHPSTSHTSLPASSSSATPSSSAATTSSATTTPAGAHSGGGGFSPWWWIPIGLAIGAPVAGLILWRRRRAARVLPG